MNTAISADTVQLDTTKEEKISVLINTAISGDVLTDDGSGLIAVMAKSRQSIQQDIPAAFEMYTLLSHFLSRLPLLAAHLGEDQPDVALDPSILHDDANGRIVALIPIANGEIGEIAYWLADGLPSERIKQMAGVLAICFSIEKLAATERLLPEWFAAFYVDGDARHCIPILALRSIMGDENFSGDWVDIALNRMAVFSLPRADATEGVKKKCVS